jgi:peptidoglycan biosynthesis protein MviN/MurJ (putative lipid II flippase)
MAYLIAVVVFINIISNILLVPIYGIIGTALSNAISYTLYLILSLLVSRRYLRWSIQKRSLLNILMSSLIMGAFLFLIKSQFAVSLINLFLLIAAGGIIYIFVLYISGEIRNELSIINKYINSLKTD